MIIKIMCVVYFLSSYFIVSLSSSATKCHIIIYITRQIIHNFYYYYSTMMRYDHNIVKIGKNKNDDNIIV